MAGLVVGYIGFDEWVLVVVGQRKWKFLLNWE